MSTKDEAGGSCWSVGDGSGAGCAGGSSDRSPLVRQGVVRQVMISVPDVRRMGSVQTRYNVWKKYQAVLYKRHEMWLRRRTLNTFSYGAEDELHKGQENVALGGREN